MEQAIIIINADDIPTAEKLAATLENYTIYTFDPVLVDRIAAAGLRPVQFIAWHTAPAYASLYEEAHASAYALEKDLDASRHDILPEVSVYSWQHLSLYYLFMSMQWYQGMWNSVGLKLSEKHLHIFISDNPSNFYFNSYIPALTLMQFCRQHDIEFSGYSYGGKQDVSNHLPDLAGRNNETSNEFLLTHLPTCMYDMAYFNQEMEASGKTIINVKAKYFSMPVQAHFEIEIIDAANIEQEIASPLRERIEAFLSIVAAKLDVYFSRTLVTTVFRERQVNQIINTYRSQLFSYFLLGRYFQEKMPSKILLSDHDTGLHGPLLAFAEKYDIPILILPHSKTTPDLEFTYKNMRALTHPSQGADILDRNQCRVPHFKLCIPTKFESSIAMPEPIKTVGLLLNAYSLNGIYFANYERYIAGIKKIYDFCKLHSLDLQVRCKPSYSLMQLLVWEVDLDIGMLYDSSRISMVDYSNQCDICLMYDTPTAGALEFLAKSIPILNPVLGPLTPPQAVTTHPHTIARESVDECLHKLASFKADPSLLQQFKMRQFLTYLNLFSDAQPLRAFI